MGVDLRIYPLDWCTGTFGFSHTVLPVPRACHQGDNKYTIWNRIHNLPSHAPLPADHDITGLITGSVPDGEAKGESMYGRMDLDAYGIPLHWVRADELANLLGEYEADCRSMHPVVAYLRELEPDTKVVLGWH